MQTFLQQASQKLLATITPRELQNTLILLPSRRAVFFMQQALQRELESPAWLPTCLAIEDFITQLTQLELVSQTELLLRFFSVYRCHTPDLEQDDFSHFVQWASTMLADFNELDAYAVDTDKLFAEVANIKSLERWNPSGEEPTELQREYLGLWSKLAIYYKVFNKELLAEDKAYLGLAYRKGADETVALFNKQFAHIKHGWWIGFNALNACEEQIIDKLLTTINIKLVWDADTYYLKFKHQEAGMFLRRHLNKWPALHEVVNTEQLLKPKRVIVHQATGLDGQAVAAAQLLNQLSENELEHTALVMANEDILMPVVQNLPISIDSFNVTASYSLKHAAYADWLMLFAKLHGDAKKRGSLYYRHLVPVIDHPVLKPLIQDATALNEAKARLVRENAVFISVNHAKQLFKGAYADDVLNRVLQAKSGTVEVLSTVVDLLDKLFQSFQPDESVVSFQQEQILAVLQVAKQIVLYSEQYQLNLQVGTLRLLLEQLLKQESVSFIGEPLLGLQIMGMLESRTLDFERIILTSVNEGVLPAGKSGRSFIPFDVKRAYGLPTHHEKDAIYAYHFYRLLQRTKEAHLIYDNSIQGLGSSEESRFIKQLEVEWQNEEKQRVFERIPGLTFPKTQSPGYLEITKDEELSKELKAYLKRGISPSALSRYIASPIDFYFRQLLRLRDVEEVNEALEDRQAGNIIHSLLEEYLLPYVNTPISSATYQDLKPSIGDEITNRLKKELNINYITGKNHLVKTYLVAFVERFIQFEEQRLHEHLITLLGVEVGSEASKQDFGRTIEVDDETFYLKGIADRIEREGNTIRVIDYKTGVVDQKELNVKELSHLFTSTDQAKALQLMIYAWIYWPQLSEGEKMESCIYSFPRAKSGLLKLKLPHTGRAEISFDHIVEFEQELKSCIQNMLDPSVSFQNREEAKYTLFKLNSPRNS